MKRLLFIFLLVPFLSFSQLSVKVDSLYRGLNATEQVQNDFIGIGSNGTVFLDYENLYTELDSIATEDELLYMAAKGNKVIKYHMNEILVDRKSKHLADLFAQYIFKDEEIYMSGGCTGNISSLAGELYRSIFYQKSKIDEIEMYKNTFTAEEIKKDNLTSETKWTKPEVDSLLTILNKTALSNDHVLPVTLRRIFVFNDFKFENYERVRYFAYKYPETETLATLASFQNKKDLPLLHQNIDKAFIAISKFPDQSFIPELKTRADKGYEDYYFMDAATSFCSKDSDGLLSMIVEKFEASKKSDALFWMGDGERYGHFYNCLEKKDCEVFDDFLIRLWINHRTISYSFFVKIKDKHYNEILEGYLNPIPFDSAPMREDWDWQQSKDEYDDADGYLCPIILKYLKNNSSLNKDKSIDLDTIECKG